MNLNDSVGEELAKMRRKKEQLLQSQSLLSSSIGDSPLHKDLLHAHRSDSIEDINHYLQTEEPVDF